MSAVKIHRSVELPFAAVRAGQTRFYNAIERVGMTVTGVSVELGLIRCEMTDRRGNIMRGVQPFAVTAFEFEQYQTLNLYQIEAV